MEKYTLEEDITVFYVSAKSFPAGITAAHEKLHSLIQPDGKRKYFGLSRPEDGVVRYKAAAQELSAGEGEKLGCKTLTIEKGEYLSILIPDYAKNIRQIGKAFDKIIAQPDIAPDGYCVECYLNDKDVRCMVRLEK